MKKDNVVSLKKPGENSDTLTELLRDGARTLLLRRSRRSWRSFCHSTRRCAMRAVVSVWYAMGIYRHGRC